MKKTNQEPAVILLHRGRKIVHMHNSQAPDLFIMSGSITVFRLTGEIYAEAFEYPLIDRRKDNG